MKTATLEKIEIGDNILVSTKSFLGKAIQEFEKCDWNHSMTVVQVYPEIVVSEAIETGIDETKLSHYTNNKKKYRLLLQKPVATFTDEEKQRIVDFAKSKKGKIKYEYANLLFFQPVKFLTGIWLGARTMKNGDKRYICGEWSARIYNYCFGWFSKWEQFAPVDLYNSSHFINYELKY